MKRFMSLCIVALFFVLVIPGYTYAAARTLVVGMSGTDVRAVQSALIQKGYLSAASVTGYFGPVTLAAIKKFQCDKRVVCSGSSLGVVGPLTQAALAGTNSNSPSVGSVGLEIGGWIPYWRSATGTLDVLPHLSKLTEVSPFVYTLKSDGTINDAGKMNQEPWVSFVAAAKAQKVRVIPTLMSGNGDLLHTILSNAEARVALEDAVAKLVMDNNFDGIDIDFEAKKAETKDYFSTFLKGLYQRMGSKWVYCSIEARMPLVDRYGIGITPPPDATTYANDYVALNKYCDRVEIMAYDQGYISALLNASRPAPYVPIADPAWVENIINLASETIAKNKILIGVPTYGYEYSVTPSGSGYQYKRLWAFNPGYGIQLATQLGIQPTRNSAGELSFMYKPTPDTDAAVARATTPGSVAPDPTINTTSPPSSVYSQTAIASQLQPPFNIVWWSDAQAINDKIVLAKKLGVRGIAVFKFDGGEDQNIWKLF